MSTTAANIPVIVGSQSAEDAIRLVQAHIRVAMTVLDQEEITDQEPFVSAFAMLSFAYGLCANIAEALETTKAGSS